MSLPSSSPQQPRPMAPEPAPYVVEDLVLSHGRLRVIDGLNLTIPQGQLTAIVGPNGCGKSTLLAGLSRLHTPTQGKVWLQGQELKRLSARDLARRHCLAAPGGLRPRGA